MYSEIFKNMSEGFAVHRIICDENEKPIDYEFLDVNLAFEKITSLKGKDIIGKKVLDILPKLEYEWIEKYGKVALTGESIEFEQYNAQLDKFFYVKAFSVKREEFVTLFMDITQRKKSELLLQKYRLFFKNARDILLFMGIDGKILDANDAAFKTYGYSKKELLDMNIVDLRYNDDVNCVNNQIQKANSNGILYELCHKKKNGEVIPVQVNSIGVKIENKSILISIIRDITEQKKIWKRLII